MPIWSVSAKKQDNEVNEVLIVKDQINRYARGVFDYEPITLFARDNSIYAVVDRNQPYSGVLCLSTKDGREGKGIVYSSNDKVVVENAGFEGRDVEIPYYVKCEDAAPGEVIEGKFCVVSNGGELEIPYSFRIEAGSHESSIGTIRNLYQFAQLCQSDSDEAVKLFMASDFAEVYLGEDHALRNIYEGLIRGSDLKNSMEEFLIAAGRKTPIHIRLAENRRTYEDITENFKDTILLERDTWGYLEVEVACDAPFVRLERRSIDADSFSGNRYEFSYVIDYDKLHAGRNCACIRFMTNNRNVPLQLVVERKDEKTERRGKMTHANRVTYKKLTMDMMTLYVRFRIHAIPVEEWIRESRIVIEAMRSLDDDNPFCRLALAQLYITEQKDAEAKALMDEVKDDIHAEREEDYPLYCYFIYVNTLYNKEYAYSKRASVMIRDCYARYEDWRILWTLLFIDEELETNPSLKLLRIKEQFNKGCHSPAMYLEACRIFNEQPQLLRVMNSFEAATLYFGAKNGILEEKLSSLAASLIISIRYGTEKYIRLMWALYQNHPTEELLECLCKILVRNNCVGPAYLMVYEEAITKQLKITQLFEFYILSRKREDMSPLPKMVLMYFGYNNSLDYQCKAYLYANIIYNKKDNPQAYRSYRSQMEEFIRDQVLLGHVSEHLCLIYQDVLTPEMVDSVNAPAVSEIFNTYLVTVPEGDAERVIVRHKELDVEKEYPIVDGVALIRMYTEDAAVYLVNAGGVRYVAGSQVEIRHLIENEEIIRRCLEVSPELLNLQLYYSEKSSKYHKNSMEAVEYRKAMLLQPGLNEFYRGRLISAIIDYYYDSYDAEAFSRFIETITPSALPETDFIRTVEIHITQGNYEHAFRMLVGHSATTISPKRLLKMCSRMVVSTNTENAQLVELCYLAFSQDRYDEVTLQYLSDYYNGPTESMVKIWRHGREFDIDTYKAEERIIAQVLFTHQSCDSLEEIFGHYYSKGPKERIVEAYLAYFAYRYFVHQEAVSESIFELIETSLENERPLAMVCEMALLQYYSGLRELSAFRKELAGNLVGELARKHYVFPFFLKLQEVIHLPFDIADRTMVEYRADVKSRVVIHYMIEARGNHKNYIAEDMKQIYDGIFVKQFALFYGESVNYYITEERSDGEFSTAQEKLSNNRIRPDRSEGRYDAINDLIAGQMTHEADTVDKLVHDYAVADYLAQDLFTML